MAHATARSRSPRVRRRRKKAELPVNAAADRNVARMAAAVAGSLSVLRAGVNREALRIALERNSPEMAIDAFAWDRWARAFEAVVLPRIGKTMEDAANAAGAKTVIQKQEGVEKIRLTLKGIFDLLNPRAQRWAAQFAARFVTRVEENTRHAMRQVIADAQAQGTGLRAQADQLAKILTDTAGLDGPRARALAQYQSRLWDSGLNVNVIDQRVQQMRDRLLMDRAKLIARHETQDAANAGQAELWNQAEEQGLLPRGWLQEWIVAPPVRRNRVCPICQGMAGQRVPRGQLFVSEYDGSTHERPPAHIQCRCALGLVDPDEVQKYDPNQPRDPAGTETGGQWTSDLGRHLGAVIVQDPERLRHGHTGGKKRNSFFVGPDGEWETDEGTWEQLERLRDWTDVHSHVADVSASSKVQDPMNAYDIDAYLQRFKRTGMSRFVVITSPGTFDEFVIPEGVKPADVGRVSRKALERALHGEYSDMAAWYEANRPLVASHPEWYASTVGYHRERLSAFAQKNGFVYRADQKLVLTPKE